MGLGDFGLSVSLYLRITNADVNSSVEAPDCEPSEEGGVWCLVDEEDLLVDLEVLAVLEDDDLLVDLEDEDDGVLLGFE